MWYQDPKNVFYSEHDNDEGDGQTFHEYAYNKKTKQYAIIKRYDDGTVISVSILTAGKLKKVEVEDGEEES